MDNKIQKLLQYVSKNVPYYTQYFESNPDKNPILLGDYPIIYKRDFVETPNLFISNNVSKETLLLKQTSGSTGIPLNIYKSKKEELSQLKSIWKIRKEFGINPNSKYLAFYLNNTNLNDSSLYRVLDNRVMVIQAFNLDIEKFKKVIEEVKKFEPDFIMGTPSAITDLLYKVKNYNLSLPNSVKYVESMSEYLFDEQRKIIQEMPNSIMSNHYGCTEILGIAQSSNDCNELHILEDNVYVEVLTNKGEITNEIGMVGEILITGLNSFNMPFIRYNLGDIVKLNNKKCCEMSTKTLEVIAGRANDYVQLPNGDFEHSSKLCKIIDETNKIVDCIIKFKFIQRKINEFEVYLTLKYKEDSSIVKRVFLEKCKFLGFEVYIWNIFFVDFIEYPQTKKKFSYFESAL